MTETVKNHNGHLTSGRLLARNTVWNLLGNGAPMVVAVICIPVLIRGLGKERFGVLMLAWALIGYASLFDLGLGRALTQLVARKLGAGEEREIPSLAWTSLLLMLLLGVLGAGIVVLLAPWLAGRGLNVPAALQGETLQSFRLLGLSLPFVITTAGLRGLLEAHQRFGLINALRIPMGVYSFASPLLVLPFSRSLFPVVTVLVAGRIAAWAAHLLVCLWVLPVLGRSIAWARSAVGPLLRSGGWMTVSNVVGPLMFYMDRLLIGALLSVSAVAYYAAPFDMVSRLTVIPSAVVGVLFSAFAFSFVQDRSRTRVLLNSALKYVFMITFPIVLVIVALAPEGLTIWLGQPFAENGASVLRWLAAGVFVNSLSTFPFVIIQSAGRPDITAKLHAAELAPYWVAVWLLTRHLGIVGSAIAWTGRLMRVSG
jgi:O-antigen/teichoic acid export membrane protein